MLGGLGWQELMVVLVIVMIIFGAGKLPEVAKSLGQGVKEFKKEATDVLPSPTSAAAAGATAADTTATMASSAEKTVRADDI